MESGGLSSWSNSDVEGYVEWTKTNTSGSGESAQETERTKTTYSILLVDAGAHGIESSTAETSITRSSVKTSAAKAANNTSKAVTYPGTGYTECTLK